MNQSVYRAAAETRIMLALLTKIAGRDLEQYLAESGYPISGLQYGVLRMISSESLTLSALSQKMMVTPATLVPAVDNLEQHGLLRRERDPRDRRRTPLQITPSGMDFLAAFAQRPIIDSLYRSMEALGEANCAQLVGLLRRLLMGMPEGPEIAARVFDHLQAHLPHPSEQSPPDGE
jgi:DNA-binding MarR family transcriptional regulator